MSSGSGGEAVIILALIRLIMPTGDHILPISSGQRTVRDAPADLRYRSPPSQMVLAVCSWVGPHAWSDERRRDPRSRNTRYQAGRICTGWTWRTYYSITSSAVASNAGGIANPSVFATL
jgi:hypothetical protein